MAGTESWGLGGVVEDGRPMDMGIGSGKGEEEEGEYDRDDASSSSSMTGGKRSGGWA